MNENVLREGLLATARSMAASGLNAGTAGNASVRCARGFLITPSGRPYEDCTGDDMALVAMDGSWSGPYAPSSEWRIHRDIFAARPEAGAVLHAHSSFATALACHRRDIPAFHYMIARFGGDSIRCAPYATFGTQALSASALTALENRNACLLANHGMLVFGGDLRHTLALAIEFETLCEQYWRACQLGTPAVLGPVEMAAVIARFKSYGQAQAANGPGLINPPPSDLD
ncbi:class II aldolase/adducin family protein [Zoogloea sp. LCSB751]|uniref:class II aldolase/adducin family protein n=1 Tax=Zoogloea sp. LCSB751 TaxID=1965277 RepID=UPI0009A49D50|nr:class II aldolase/adducin family protein [Zoogloea sp. LCSB751]